jgi:hypothetical protein
MFPLTKDWSVVNKLMGIEPKTRILSSDLEEVIIEEETENLLIICDVRNFDCISLLEECNLAIEGENNRIYKKKN